MSDLQNPALALEGFQDAFNAGFIRPHASDLFSDLVVLHDAADGAPRYTYAMLDGETVKAIAVFFLEKVIGQYPCFDIGYAVAEPYRNQGNAHGIVEKSLAQFQRDLGVHVPKYYVEAVVLKSNNASQKVAAAALGIEPEEIIDSVSGKPALLYRGYFEV
ncbi:GNAT family N-acetyltransferase [Pseudomonas aeruginosa]|uniref:GNAT family N-acetyltransferase n=1 Tax=Pseudomonas aeruginosa TaxID=287 RepID=UPI00071B7664|nr:GNAT family N-acetyltransferase [Pseudomonas aeruginosa]